MSKIFIKCGSTSLYVTRGAAARSHVLQAALVKAEARSRDRSPIVEVAIDDVSSGQLVAVIEHLERQHASTERTHERPEEELAAAAADRAHVDGLDGEPRDRLGSRQLVRL